MVKKRPGSRKGLTKLGTASKKAARRQAARQKNGLASKRAIVHKGMRESWDRRQSPANNMARVGLVSSVNSVQKSRDMAGRAIEFAQIPTPVQCSEVLKTLEEQASIPERPPKQIVRPGERIALQKLTAKYGKDWRKMSRDLRLNYLQWSPEQLERKIGRMHNILAQNN